METIKYNEAVSIDIKEKCISIYENKERDFTARDYTINKILIEIEIEKSFVDITYESKSKGLICKRIESITNLLLVDKKHLIKKVMELIKNDIKIEL